MDLIELLLSFPDLIVFVIYLFKGLWWLTKGLVTLLGMGVQAAGSGIAWLIARVRDRGRRRDFPTATVIAGDRLRSWPWG